MWEVSVLYPLIILAILLTIILFKLAVMKLKLFSEQEKTFSISSGLTRWDRTVTKKCAAYGIGFIVMVVGFYSLQSYRDNTRYIYYHGYSDLTNTPKIFVNGWEFLDNPDDKKTIALTMDW